MQLKLVPFGVLVFLIILDNSQCNDEVKRSYKNYKVYKVIPKSNTKNILVKSLAEVVDDFFSDPLATHSKSFDILISPTKVRPIQKILKHYSAKFEVVVQDLEKDINSENSSSDFEDENFDLDSESQLYSPIKSVSKRGIFDDVWSLFLPTTRSFESQRGGGEFRQKSRRRRPRKISDESFNEISGSKENTFYPKMNWKFFHRLDTINRYMKDLQKTYPHLVQIDKIGHSFEGRPILALKLGAKKNYKKPAILIDGGIHAREWISPATVTFIVKSLVENYDQNSDLMDFYDFFVIPVLNPDGYEFSHKRDRLWRKNRSRSSSSLTGFLLPTRCEGVDLNRNFDFDWGGTSIFDIRSGNSLACSETYSGPEPFSESESRAYRDFVLSQKDQIVMVLSFHSFGEKIVYPFSSTSNSIPDWRELHHVGVQMARAINIETGGRDRYEVGSAPDVQYLVTGGSNDWIRGVAGIKWVFLIELPDSKEHKFILPRSHIVPIAKSALAAVRTAAREISQTIVR